MSEGSIIYADVTTVYTLEPPNFLKTRIYQLASTDTAQVAQGEKDWVVNSYMDKSKRSTPTEYTRHFQLSSGGLLSSKRLVLILWWDKIYQELRC